MHVEDARLLISPESSPSLGNNINGPSLIKVPAWVQQPLGRYYLYFAHHQGNRIRLAYSDQVMGPYTVHEPGALSLADSGFPDTPLERENITAPGVLNLIEQYGEGPIIDLMKPHIASPDVHIRPELQQIWMYYHGQLDDGHQVTRVAMSPDGLNFAPLTRVLGNNYFRVFRHGEWFYALAHAGGTLYRSRDGTAFEEGPVIGDPGMRHTAIRKCPDEHFQVFWSRFGDEPEHILVSELVTEGDWTGWKIEDTRSVRKPEFDWEGANIEIRRSRAGFTAVPLHELRDPGIYEEDGETYLLYSVKGESGIGIGRLR